MVLTAVCDTDPGRLAAATAAYSCQGYSDYEKMLIAQRPDVVHICTPHHLHADMAIRCLEQNINVLLEKPVATTVVDAAAVAEAADRSSAIFGVCFQNRYNPTSHRLREILGSKQFGTVHSALASVIWSRDAAYYRHREWRGRWATAGGGVLINQAIHTLDLLQWYLGEPKDVRGSASTLLLPEPIEIEDTASVVMTHADGRRSVFFATNTYSDNEPITIELRTERATLRLHTDLTVVHPDGTQELLVEQQERHGEKAYWGASHGLLIDDFYHHVHGAADSGSTLERPPRRSASSPRCTTSLTCGTACRRLRPPLDRRVRGWSSSRALGVVRGRAKVSEFPGSLCVVVVSDPHRRS